MQLTSIFSFFFAALQSTVSDQHYIGPFNNENNNQPVTSNGRNSTQQQQPQRQNQRSNQQRRRTRHKHSFFGSYHRRHYCRGTGTTTVARGTAWHCLSPAFVWKRERKCYRFVGGTVCEWCEIWWRRELHTAYVSVYTGEFRERDRNPSIESLSGSTWWRW